VIFRAIEDFLGQRAVRYDSSQSHGANHRGETDDRLSSCLGSGCASCERGEEPLQNLCRGGLGLFAGASHFAAQGCERGRSGSVNRPHRGKIYPLYGPVELTHDEIAKLVGGVLGREITYQSMPIEKWAEVVAGASAGRPPRNDAGSLYPEADRITGRPGSEFLVQHLREVAIDHTNGIFAGTNEFVETIGGQPPLTVEAFVAKHRDAFV